MIELMITKIQQ